MINRRTFLQGTTAIAGLSALGKPALAANEPIKIGFVSPRSGPLAPFSDSDDHVIGSFLKSQAAKDLNIEVIIKDGQSNANRGSEVTRELIVEDEVSLVLVAGTPETTNPVSTICEAEQVPCISSVAPWQSWFDSQQRDPANPQPFRYAYHFFWGYDDLTSAFINMWKRLDTNKSVGALFPNDADGNAMGDDSTGLPGIARGLGYKVTDLGRFQNLSDDYSAQIRAFIEADAEILTGAVIPPDFITFWTQAKQQGYNPKFASVAKALLFPQVPMALGDLGHNLACDVYWSPAHPYKSSLTGESSAEIAAGFTEATGRIWSQPIGFSHALFEVAVDALRRVDDHTNFNALAEAISTAKVDSIVGRLAWGGDDVPTPANHNVTKTPVVGGQWRRIDGDNWSLEIVDN
ncbi:MAG: ABC transporter substrate-binding protein, partial [Candidatus Competibacteraceae bacterium]|nr:ABC transporter substrate-binding protein [Candidatus Competibacteraceae bacterium]